MDLIVPKSHIALASVEDVNSICAPLFTLTEIDFFYYLRYYPDDSVIVLSSNGEFLQSSLSDDLSGSIIDWESISTLFRSAKPNQFISDVLQPYWFIADVIPNNIYVYITDRFKLKTGIKIVEKFNDYYEVCWFDSTSGKNLSGFYLSNFDILARFLLYFREKASQLIKDSERAKVVIPERNWKHKKHVLDFAKKECLDKSRLQNLREQLNVKRYRINLEGNIAEITKREHNCLLCLGSGCSIKRTAHLMGVSPKTIESHLQNIKIKLGLCSKEQLLLVYRNSLLSKIKHG